MPDTLQLAPERRRHRAQPRLRKDRIPGHVRVGLAADLQVMSDIDGRFRIAKRFREVVAAIVAEQGGVDTCSEVRRQLIRRFGAACVLAEDIEARLAAGEEADVERFAVLCSVLCRLAHRIGVNRVPKTVEPLGVYLEQKYGASAEAAEAEEALE